MNRSDRSEMSPPEGARVAVAMSGGVDSAVAALLLVEAGCAVTGVTLKLWCSEDFPERETEKSCCSREALGDAAATAARLGIPHHVWDYSEEFRRAVIDPFREEYFRGRTPNPCVECNRKVRFRLLHERLRRAGFDRLATGHYARIDSGPAGPRLMRAADRAKDQSYVLWGIGREALAHTSFPLGELTKKEVRAIAADRGLPVAEREESQDICFIPDGDLASFLSDRREGDIVDGSGEKVGTHSGAARYTVGQRRGLGIAAPEPLYVTGVDVGGNVVRVGRGDELLARGADLGETELLVPAEELAAGKVRVRIRYRHEPAAARVELREGGRARVLFDEPQRAVTPGQSAVFYRGEVVLGGGVIEGATGK